MVIPHDGESAIKLSRLDLSGGETAYSEDWLQRLLFEHPELLPIEQVEPTYSDAAPLCREMRTPAGSVDIVMVTETGVPVLVETKLWRNPEARRHAVVQILDYAKEISTWSADRLEDAVRRSRQDGRSIFAAVADRFEEPDEAAFYDGLARNLENGRCLLLIVGDGIREGVERIADYLQTQIGLRLSFGLIEIGIYELPTDPGGLLIQPSLLAKTVEIERAVVVRRSPEIVIEEPSAGAPGKRESVTESSIYESLEGVDPGLPRKLRDLFNYYEEHLGLSITVKRSLILHWLDDEGNKIANFGQVFANGTLRTNYICDFANTAGDRSIGVDYLNAIARLCPGAKVRAEGKLWTWRVVKDGRDPPVAPFLDHADEWLRAVETAMDRFRNIAETG